MCPQLLPVPRKDFLEMFPIHYMRSNVKYKIIYKYAYSMERWEWKVKNDLCLELFEDEKRR